MPNNPELQAALERARHHVMTPAERDAQRRSWVRGEMMLERPEMTADEVNALMGKAGEARPIPAAAVEPKRAAVAALAYAMWDAEHMSKLGENPLDQERMFHLAEQTIVWLEVFQHAVVALLHLAAPADVAGLVARLRSGEACADNTCRVMDARSGCICGEAADKLTAVAVERDEHKRTAERLDVKLFAFTGRAIKAESERDEARRHIVIFKDNLKVAREANCALEAANTALLSGERAIVPQSLQHAESLYAGAVSSLRAYGVDPEAERDEGAELDVARQQTRAAIERATDALHERDALAERLAASQRMTQSAQRIIDRLEGEIAALAERLRVVEAELDRMAQYARWQISECGTYHPTLPSALGAAEATLRNSGYDRLADARARIAALTQASAPETGGKTDG